MKKNEDREIIKFDNTLNCVPWGKFSTAELDTFWFMLQQSFLQWQNPEMRAENNGWVVMNYDEVLVRLGLEKKALSRKQAEILLENRLEKIGFATWRYENQDNRMSFILWQKIIVSKNGNKIGVLPADGLTMILEATKNFTVLELGNILDLKSKYAKALYPVLQQYKFTGIVKISIEQLKHILGAEKRYLRFDHFKERVLDPAIKELQATFPNLNYSLMKNGNRYEKITFTFKPEERQYQHIEEPPAGTMNMQAISQ
jgi:hypothetical protein